MRRDSRPSQPSICRISFFRCSKYVQHCSKEMMTYLERFQKQSEKCDFFNSLPFLENRSCKSCSGLSQLFQSIIFQCHTQFSKQFEKAVLTSQWAFLFILTAIIYSKGYFFWNTYLQLQNNRKKNLMTGPRTKGRFYCWIVEKIGQMSSTSGQHFFAPNSLLPGCFRNLLR